MLTFYPNTEPEFVYYSSHKHTHTHTYICIDEKYKILSTLYKNRNFDIKFEI